MTDTDTVPQTGCCETAFAGYYACRHVELSGDEVDGCAIDHPFCEDHNPDREVCPAFECSVAAMLERLGGWSERLETRLKDVRREATQLVDVVEEALTNPARESDVRDAVERTRVALQKRP